MQRTLNLYFAHSAFFIQQTLAKRFDYFRNFENLSWRRCDQWQIQCSDSNPPPVHHPDTTISTFSTTVITCTCVISASSTTSVHHPQQPSICYEYTLTTRYGGGGGALNQCKQYWWSPCQQYQLVNNTRRTIIRAPANPVPCPTLFTPVTRRQVWEIFKNRLKTQKRELEIIFIFWALFL